MERMSRGRDVRMTDKRSAESKHVVATRIPYVYVLSVFGERGGHSYPSALNSSHHRSSILCLLNHPRCCTGCWIYFPADSLQKGRREKLLLFTPWHLDSHSQCLHWWKEMAEGEMKRETAVCQFRQTREKKVSQHSCPDVNRLFFTPKIRSISFLSFHRKISGRCIYKSYPAHLLLCIAYSPRRGKRSLNSRPTQNYPNDTPVLFVSLTVCVYLVWC